MKVREFLKKEIDIDVCDDYDESCCIAFCGPQPLTKAGEEHFAKALDFDIEVHDDEPYDSWAIIHVDNDEEVALARELFVDIAGYCPESTWDKYFESLYQVYALD